MIQAIVFDFDMTLVDSVPVIDRAVKEYFSRTKLKKPDLSIKDAMGLTTELYAAEVVSCNPSSQLTSEQIFGDFATTISCCADQYEIKHADTLLQIQESGIRLGIISNTLMNAIEKVLLKTDLTFNLIISSDQPSHLRSKEERLRYSLEYFNCRKEELAYVGDHPNDIEAAKAAGVVSVGISTGLHSEDELRESGPDTVIRSLKEIKCLAGR